MAFEIDTRLADSSAFVIDLPLCQVRLKKDKTYPWVILIPRREGIREIFDLTAADRAVLVEEMALAGQIIKNLYHADKVNTAAYGNMVPQLHVHIFARHQTDGAWPKPVWAVQTQEIPYNNNEMESEVQKLHHAFTNERGAA